MKLTDPQIKLLKRAASDTTGDGAAFIGYAGRLASVRVLKRAGLAELMVGGGRMPRISITQAGREALAALSS